MFICVRVRAMLAAPLQESRVLSDRRFVFGGEGISVNARLGANAYITRSLTHQL